MPKVTLYTLEGKQNGEMQLNDAIFGIAPKEALVHQVYVALEANAREPWADTKDRGEVRGGGRKPWKQKGTGRARHGSIRSPIWKGGGVTFGPLSERNYKQKINKKMGRKAVAMCLADKLATNTLIVLENLPDLKKTKEVVNVLKSLPLEGKRTLIVTAEKDENLNRVVRNVKNVDVVRADDVNVVDLMHHTYIVTNKSSIERLEKRLA